MPEQPSETEVTLQVTIPVFGTSVQKEQVRKRIEHILQIKLHKPDLTVGMVVSTVERQGITAEIVNSHPQAGREPMHE